MVVCLDPFFALPASRIAETAFTSGIPIVIVDRRYDDPLLRQSSAAAAAIVCTRFPGVLKAPTFDDVADFMRAAKRNVPSG
jgi:hypothetical protein